jgi:hypothetical protein
LCHCVSCLFSHSHYFLHQWIFHFKSYFITIGILQYYTSFIEKGCIISIKQINGGTNKYIVYSKAKKYDSNYVLDVELRTSSSNKAKISTFKQSFGNYFDMDGNLLVEKYHSDLCNFFDKISQSDKKDK